jgi:hypothetical protein
MPVERETGLLGCCLPTEHITFEFVLREDPEKAAEFHKILGFGGQSCPEMEISAIIEWTRPQETSTAKINILASLITRRDRLGRRDRLFFAVAGLLPGFILSRGATGASSSRPDTAV